MTTSLSTPKTPCGFEGSSRMFLKPRTSSRPKAYGLSQAQNDSLTSFLESSFLDTPGPDFFQTPRVEEREPGINDVLEQVSSMTLKCPKSLQASVESRHGENLVDDTNWPSNSDDARSDNRNNFLFTPATASYGLRDRSNCKRESLDSSDSTETKPKRTRRYSISNAPRLPLSPDLSTGGDFMHPPPCFSPVGMGGPVSVRILAQRKLPKTEQGGSLWDAQVMPPPAPAGCPMAARESSIGENSALSLLGSSFGLPPPMPLISTPDVDQRRQQEVISANNRRKTQLLKMRRKTQLHLPEFSA